MMASHSTYWTVYSDRKLGHEYRTYNSLEQALKQCARDRNCNGVTAQVDKRVVVWEVVWVVWFHVAVNSLFLGFRP